MSFEATPIQQCHQAALRIGAQDGPHQSGSPTSLLFDTLLDG
jgi:hypothetical protein